MSLPHAILIALTEKSGSGLDLARRFGKSIGYFWPATHQQIYRELARLEAAGLIASEAQPGARGGKRLYRVLPAGLAELRRWVPLGEDGPPLRDALMVRLRGEAALGPTGLADALHDRIAEHERKLAEYRAIKARDFGGAPSSRADALRGLILDGGIRNEAGWIELLREALRILEADETWPEAPLDASKPWG